APYSLEATEISHMSAFHGDLLSLMSIAETVLNGTILHPTKDLIRWALCCIHRIEDAYREAADHFMNVVNPYTNELKSLYQEEGRELEKVLHRAGELIPGYAPDELGRRR